VPVGIFGKDFELAGCMHGGGHVEGAAMSVVHVRSEHTDRFRFRKEGAEKDVGFGGRVGGYIHEP
jgi:hypothetical protein